MRSPDSFVNRVFSRPAEEADDSEEEAVVANDEAEEDVPNEILSDTGTITGNPAEFRTILNRFLSIVTRAESMAA